MDITGQQLIPASQRRTWEALNDLEVLKASIPGCESITATGDNEFEVLLKARIGPVSAKFKGRLTLSDLDPPNGYSMAFEGQGGVAGFAKGTARVALRSEDGEQTRLEYHASASLGGKLAQVGSRLVEGAAKLMADSFFKSFTATVAGAAPDRT